MSRINELLEMRNELVDEEDQIELYDIMDAAETEEIAIYMLEREIEKLMKR